MSTFEFHTDGLLSRGPNVRCQLNGQDLTAGCRAVHMSADVTSATKVTVEMFARDGVDFSVQADVTVNLQVLPGYELIESPGPDGSKRYRAVRAGTA